MNLKTQLYKLRTKTQRNADKHCAFKYGLLRILMILSSADDYEETLQLMYSFLEECEILYAKNKYDKKKFLILEALLNIIINNLETMPDSDLPLFRRTLIKIYNESPKRLSKS